MFSMVAPAYAKRYGVDPRRCATCSRGSPRRTTPTAPATPKAQFRKEMAGREAAGDAAGRRAAVGLRLRRCRRRLGRGDRRAAPRTRTATPTSRCIIKALSFVAGNGGGLERPDLRLHALPRGRRVGRGRLRAGRHHRPAGRAGDGRGARLLHPDRAGADGRPRILRARHGLEGDPGRDVRPRR